MKTQVKRGQWIGVYDDPSSLRHRLRLRRLQPLLRMIEAIHRERGAVDIIDIGGTERYWGLVPQDFLDACQVHVTIVNVPGMELPEDHGRFRFLTGDGCALGMIADQGFDIAHSNSVIEHVGDWTRMREFASETKRVARHYFVQTPNYWFPIEPHCMTLFIHWLPKPLRLWLVMRRPLGHWQRARSVDEGMRIIESARLLTKKMLAALFAEGDVHCERLFLLPKSYTAVFSAPVPSGADAMPHSQEGRQ